MARVYDFLQLTGLVIIAVGVGMLSIPIGVIVGGIATVVVGVVMKIGD